MVQAITRCFIDSGSIVTTKAYVSSNYRRFKDIFMSKRDKIPKPVAGLDGIYSLKRLIVNTYYHLFKRLMAHTSDASGRERPV